MIVLDASALTDWLLGTPGRGEAIAEEMRRAGHIHTLDFASIEILSALRRKTSTGELSARRAVAAIDDLALTPLLRHAVAPLVRRIWDLRRTHSSYDAAYVALAEVLEAPLVTTDGRLARSRGHGATILDPTASGERG